MSNLEKAMQQAIEALENTHDVGCKQTQNAITALRQALEQKQEPAAWMYSDAQGRTTLVKSNVAPYEDATPLYTEPQKREWVGLTDEEIESISEDIERSDFFDCVVPFAHAIEAKVKEKNR